MPRMQVLVEGINRIGQLRHMSEAPDHPDRVERFLGPGRKLADFADELFDAELTADAKSYLEAWPEALNEGVRAAMYNAAKRGQRLQVQWIPGYDFEVRMWEPRSDGGSPGGLVVQFVSPYPSDVLAKTGNRPTSARAKKTTAAKKRAR